MARFIPFIAWFALALYASIDCGRTPRESMPGRLAKPLWFLIIILVPFGLGAVAWIVVKGAQQVEDRQRYGGGFNVPSAPNFPSFPNAPRRRRGPVAPDDDPNFLAHLEQQARARRREERQAARDAETFEPRRDEDGTAPSSGTNSPQPDEN